MALPDDTIRFDLGHSDGIRSLMASRGVPRHLLKGSVILEENGLSPCIHTAFKPIQAKVQMSQLRRSVENPTHGSYLLVIGSLYEEGTAEAVAVGIMQYAMQRAVTSPSESPRPFLHPVYGGWKDRLRDDEAYRSGIGRIGMLVLTNLADNSTPAKLEAARDLLHMYSSIPRVLVVAGTDPWAFSIDVLRRKPSRVLNIGSMRGRAAQVRSI